MKERSGSHSSSKWAIRLWYKMVVLKNMTKPFTLQMYSVLREHRRQKGLTGRTSMLHDDGMVVCGFLGIFMTRKNLGLHSEVSRDPIKPTKMIVEQENNFEKTVTNVKLSKNTFE